MTSRFINFKINFKHRVHYRSIIQNLVRAGELRGEQDRSAPLCSTITSSFAVRNKICTFVTSGNPYGIPGNTISLNKSAFEK